jgi:hypothetical protein
MSLPQDVHLISDINQIRDLGPDALEAPGRPRIMPASFYYTTSVAERALLGHRNGIYSFPTAELVDWLCAVIDGRSAIEIGAGNGALAAALGIPATDNKMQSDPLIGQIYAATGQPPVIYGPNVEQLDAAAAIAHYRPQVVLACWVTHLFDENRPQAGGNMFGVDEEALIKACDTYIFIGNTHVHKNKSIWRHAHIKIEPDWLYSRAVNGSPEFIAVWENKTRKTIGA